MAAKHWIDKLKEGLVSEPKRETFFCGINIIASHLFPYRRTFPACDIETREEVNIISDENVIGIMVDSAGEIKMILTEPAKNEY